MDVEMLFGEMLKKYRKQASLSQEELAHLCSLDRTYISLLERGKRRPTLNTIFTIAKALQINPSTIVQDVEKAYEDNRN